MSDPKILLYYTFAPVADPEAVRLWQRELCESLGLRGRIIVSKHGINGTVGGEIDACKQYLRRTREYGPFAGLEVKWSEGTGFADDAAEPLHGIDRRAPWRRITDFPGLSVKARDELVAFGLADETEVDAAGIVGGGVHLSPEAVNELVAERGEDVVFFDGRNAYEATIGRFKDAVVPEVSSTHGFIEQIEQGAFDDIKDRPVVTYCTGGIRCEILSAAMIKRGFSEVYQIDGGIVRYGEAFGNDGLWEGSLAVFDGREALDFAPNAAVLGRCAVCATPSSTLQNCADPSCRARFVTCAEHADARCTEHGGSVDASPAAVASAAQAG
ncbi:MULTISPECIES: rhodanese-related sulfurtransferase [unclassified Leucobacter]|uniref:tRNA uridine(34) hydroxylase n=1 Tax=unclassified Leucobacter TaxID=2621730 RepID=UPI00165DCB57|nr:rhodanese-related sulfurtransferase [Leucobacter sp. cx-87]